jgi:hypothetical protein
MTAHFPGLVQVQNGYPYTYTWPLTSLAWYRYKMDTHTPIHDRWLPWLGTDTKWIPIHLYMTADFPGLVQVQNGYPYTYIHDRSLPWLGTGTKWIPIHLYMTADFPDLVQVQNGYLYTYTWPLTSLAWYRYKMDTHTPIHNRWLPWLGTGTKWLPIHLYMTAHFPGLVQVQQ